VSKPGPLVCWARGAAESLFATLFPADCRLCGSPLTNISRLPVCRECLKTIGRIGCPTCSLCGEGLGAAAEPAEPLCGLCRRAKPPFARAVAYGSYDGALRGLIHLLKYERVRPAGKALGKFLAGALTGLSPSLGSAPVVVVPVPLHRGKLRQRGFNQAELTARAALRLLADGGGFVLNTRVLKRQRSTESQTGLTRHQRRENIRGAFVVSRPDLISGQKVLLVDDVFTTGTTVSECARILLRAGASRVWVATVARTLKTEAGQPGLEWNRAEMASAA
jgi:ComF family protein